MEHADRLALEARFDALERAVDDAFGDRLLAVEHDRIHELRQDDIPELRIGEDFALLWATTTRHWKIPFSSAGPGLQLPGAYSRGLLGTLGAVFRARLPAILDTLGIEHAAKHVIPNARKVAYTAATDQHHAVLLEVVALAGDVADHFTLVGQANLGHLAKRRVRLLRGRRINPGADAALLRVLLHRRDLRLGLLRFATLADQLVNRWHEALHLSLRGRPRGYFAQQKK